MHNSELQFHTNSCEISEVSFTLQQCLTISEVSEEFGNKQEKQVNNTENGFRALTCFYVKVKYNHRNLYIYKKTIIGIILKIIIVRLYIFFRKYIF